MLWSGLWLPSHSINLIALLSLDTIVQEKLLWIIIMNYLIVVLHSIQVPFSSILQAHRPWSEYNLGVDGGHWHQFGVFPRYAQLGGSAFGWTRHLVECDGSVCFMDSKVDACDSPAWGRKVLRQFVSLSFIMRFIPSTSDGRISR